jgi:hypothetical protein
MMTTHFVILRWRGVSKKSSSLMPAMESRRGRGAVVPAG